MGIIPLQLDDEIIEKIDLLVQQGKYKNRSEALRDQIVKNLEKISLIDNPDKNSKEYQKALSKLLKRKAPPQFLNTEKTLTQLVSEGRER